MTTETYTHQFANWAKERLNEIDATLASIETRASTLQADAKKQTEKAVSEIRAQRQVFQEAIHKQNDESEAGWAKAKSGLEANWTSFEGSVQKYLGELRQNGEQLGVTFKARAEAQRKAWQETLNSLHTKASTFTAAKKQEVDAALAHLKAEAEAAKSKLETHHKAGEQSWAAFKTALEESRGAFDRATRTAVEAFKRAA